MLKRCLAIDLEVGPRDGRIHRFAAVRGDTGAAFAFGGGGSLSAALADLDAFAAGARFLLGHNLTAFDVPHLRAAKPGLALLDLPHVDTLRLNPLAFPRHPYHHLVKHYQDGELKRGRLNDPKQDAELALTLFRDQQAALRGEAAPELLLAWHWLTAADNAGLEAFFATLRGAPCPSPVRARAAIRARLDGITCATAAAAVAEADEDGWPLAYALAWLSVAGGNSVMPPWVRHQFPAAGALVRRLRDRPCDAPECTWCRERHDAARELTRWFGFPAFRDEPRSAGGEPLQQAIVETAMRGEHALGILPTGAGKSLCYQVPALSRYDKTGALTVVISPLVALMADQVTGLEARGIASCAALNGLLSMPERADVLDRVRLGDVAILIVSPEQLRNRAFRRAAAQREIGAWVLDEAHCLSRWGHDFRPDYRYVGRFIRERAGEGAIPPVLCLTATAKPDVVNEILTHFRDKVGIALACFDGGAKRDNLEFAVVSTTPGEKLAHVHQVLEADLPASTDGGAIVYCATRRHTEEVAEFLRIREVAADHFHAGLSPEKKKDVQQRFIRGELRVIAATNAFGMGIDKPDVRLVIHADIPGSLENYLQEAGRAGRDRRHARCVLLYTLDDVERQFGMSARSRLSQRDIQAVLKALRRLDRRKGEGRHASGEVVATAGEILTEEEDGTFERDSATDDTRVRSAIAWLEESALLTREENRVQVFPSSLRVSSVDEAGKRLAKRGVAPTYRRQLLDLVEALIEADADEGISTDELMGVSALNAEGVRKALHDLEELGIASNDTGLTAYVHHGVERSSRKRLASAQALEMSLIAVLRETAPDLTPGETSILHLRRATQALKDSGHDDALPERLNRLVRSLAGDGWREVGGRGSISVRALDRETLELRLARPWSSLEKTAELRRAAASRLLEHLLACLPAGRSGTDLLAETTHGKLLAAIREDLVLSAEVREPHRLLDRALLWLHEQEVIRLNKGLAVFRPAMTIRLAADRRRFAKHDFEPLALHYAEQVLQIHVMAEYVQRGLETMAEAVRMTLEYFRLERSEFLRRWLPGREQEIARQTTPASWRSIVESLDHPVQERIVTDERDQTNVLVIAGPGSGKTRVLVHRIAYLIRVRRESPRTILALAYNRHAAVAIRQRLESLIGRDARGVTVLTCHALAMRLTGVSFAARAERDTPPDFDRVLTDAAALLAGSGLPPDEADAQREQLLAGFRWILVDEYQDVGPGQYALIAALAGRSLADADGKLSLFAVGDDDQNVYAFDGASVEYIRRFAADYEASPDYLTESYRSTAHVVAAANRLIAPARRRMKAEHPIVVDRHRAEAPPGGDWQARDPVGRGRVQVLPAGASPVEQAVTVMAELERLAVLDPDWDWRRAAVIAREWQFLDPIRSYCELHGIPAQMAHDDCPGFWRLRETQALVRWLREDGARLTDAAAVEAWLGRAPAGPWWELLGEAVEAYRLETGGAALPVAHFVEWLAEWGQQTRRRQTGLLLLTAHRAKGLEFDHVAVLDGGWDKVGRNEDPDAPRRLYYVAMTRARQTLTLARLHKVPGTVLSHLDDLPADDSVLWRHPAVLPPPDPALERRYRRLAPAGVDLGFAGRHAPGHPVHRAIAGLTAGSPLECRRTGDRWLLVDETGNTVGRLARAFTAPSDAHAVEARVFAILERTRDDGDAAYRDYARCERWEVVLPELVYH